MDHEPTEYEEKLKLYWDSDFPFPAEAGLEDDMDLDQGEENIEDKQS